MLKSKESFGHIFFLHFEWLALAGMLAAAATIDPSMPPLFCPVEWIGIDYCPGNGIGRAISSALRGDFYRSYDLHPAGIPAVVVLTARIGRIFYRNRMLSKTINKKLL